MSMINNTRSQSPLLETKIKVAIRKRGIELLGLIFISLAILTAISLWSHSPNDQNILNSTPNKIYNLMGPIGAYYATILMLAVGLASWTLTLAFLIWGVRLTIHKGSHLILRRGVFFPIFIAFCAVFMATFTEPSSWLFNYSLGGFSGDALLEKLKSLIAIDLTTWEKEISISLGIFTIWIGLFSLGFSLHEVKIVLQKAGSGIFLILVTILKVLRKFTLIVPNRFRTYSPHKKEVYKNLESNNDHILEPNIDNSEDLQPQKPKEQKIKALFTSIPIFGGNEKEAPTESIVLNPTAYLDTGQHLDRVTRRIQKAVHEKKLQSGRDAPMTVIEPVVDMKIASSPDAGFYDAIVADEDKSELPLTTERKEPTLMRPSPPKSMVEYPSTKPIPQSSRAKSEAQPTLFSESTIAYERPALSLLESPKTIVRQQLSDEALEENARMLENVLDDYGVKGEIVSVRPGPVVTMYELEPAPGLKASRVIGLADDIARSMSALAARVSTVPGRTVIGIELPNDHRETVLLREILSARDFGDGKHGLPLALGKNIAGIPEVADLAKMPHLLIAGTTGSGKSVAINTMLLSLLYKLSPDECRMIMIDPKMLELSVYDGIPHLLSPVVTDPRKAVVALKWVVGEMEERYRKMSKMGVRNISGYNGRVAEALAKNNDFERTVQTGFDDNTGEPIFETETFKPVKLPFIVVVVDEMADLMMVAGKEIEACIQRLAQMARASGIHLIMATQRPSVDVITGTIKANFPTRISFQVTSKIDSRTILGEMGAEQLLGMGDMLYMAGGGKITRIHAPFVSDEEVELIVTHLKSFGPPEYVSGVIKGSDDEKASNLDSILGLGGNTDKETQLYDQAVAIVAHDRKCSTSYIQRKLSIGYNKAAKIVEEMEDNGIVSSANHIGKREIFLPENDYD